MIEAVAVSGYRSLRSVVLPLGRLTVVTGGNGAGKSNLYRSLRLLAGVAQGTVVAALAREGGLGSALWAGPRSTGPVALRLGFRDDEFGYALDLGLPAREPRTSMFERDPQLKVEVIWHGPTARPSTILVDRRNGVATIRDDSGRRVDGIPPVPPLRSILQALADPVLAPEVLAVRSTLWSWRFYDHLRTDPGAPARRPQVGTQTPTLDDEGAALASVLQTIRETGDESALADAVDSAFPGSSVGIRNHDGLFEVELHQPGLHRPVRAAELSDGTLRYLLLCAALLSPERPGLLVLNEPETSLHPSLLPAVARLVRDVARSTQVVLVTHSAALLDALGDPSDDDSFVELRSVAGETEAIGRGLLDTPAWSWPRR